MAFAKDNNYGGMLLHAAHTSSAGLVYARLPGTLKNYRHAAALMRRPWVYLFHTRIGDAPERVRVTAFHEASLRSAAQYSVNAAAKFPPADCAAIERDVIVPTMEYEGAGLGVRRSGAGPALNSGERALRDPDVFEDHGTVYIFYSVNGESGIAGGRLLPGPTCGRLARSAA